MTAQPDADVTLEVTSGDTGEAMVSPAALTFTPASWNVPQMVTVTGADDFWIDGSQTTLVTVSVNDAVSDGKFGGVSDQTVTVTTADNDVAGLKLSRTRGDGLGSRVHGHVHRVADRPAAQLCDVDRDERRHPGEATVSPTLLTFTTADWNVPQTVTVTGVDDQLVDGNQLTLVALSVVDAVSDDAFDMMPDQSVYVTTTDDDEAGFTLSRIALTVSESGTTGTFTVVLAAQPVLNVRLTITSGDVGEATVSPPALTFTPANWNVPQTVTVTGVDDHAIDGSQLTQVTVSVDDAMSDNQFDALADQSVFVTTTDDDAAGFTLSKTSVAVSESGTTDTLTAVLTAQPAASVTLTVISAGRGRGDRERVVPDFHAGQLELTANGDDHRRRRSRPGRGPNHVGDGRRGRSQLGRPIRRCRRPDRFGHHGGQQRRLAQHAESVRRGRQRPGRGGGRVEDHQLHQRALGRSILAAAARRAAALLRREQRRPVHGRRRAGGDQLHQQPRHRQQRRKAKKYGLSQRLPPTGSRPPRPVNGCRLLIRPVSVRPMDLPQPASTRRTLRTDAVFAAWPDAPGDELADTLAQDLHRVTL